MSTGGSPRMVGVDVLQHSSGNSSPRLDSGAPSKVSKSSGWRAASHIGSVVDDWPMYSSQAGDYILGPPVGFGASSVVYQASFQPLNGRACAVKVIDLEAFGRDLAELRRETQLMSLSKHPNVLRVRGCWVDGAKLHIATRLMNAGSMLDIMRFSFCDGFDEVVIATVLKQALDGLNYLHINGWLHRDLKAANMLVDDDGTVLLGDFGVGVYLTETGKQSKVKATDDHNRADSINQAARKSFVGTPCWMAPEVVERKGYGAKADIWSFGITALELSSGRAPHSRLPPVKVLMRTLQDDPPKLDRENGAFKYSKLFDDFVKQCLQKDPAKRPSAEKLLQHGFFKQARSKRYLVNAILAGLPPLAERQERRRAMSIASLQNQASWDFGPVEANSRLATPAHEGTDPFMNFSGVIASPKGSMRSTRLISIDGEHAILGDSETNVNHLREGWRNSVGSARKSRPPSEDHGLPFGSLSKHRSRAQRLSVSFHFDEADEPALKETTEACSIADGSSTKQAVDSPHLSPIKETTKGDTTATGADGSSGQTGNKVAPAANSLDDGNAKTPPLTDGSAASSKPASLETPAIAQEVEEAQWKKQKKRESVKVFSKLFKRP